MTRKSLKKTPDLAHFLRIGTCCAAVALHIFPLGAIAFDPNEGAEPATRPNRSALPSTDALLDQPPQPVKLKIPYTLPSAASSYSLAPTTAVEAIAAPLANAKPPSDITANSAPEQIMEPVAPGAAASFIAPAPAINMPLESPPAPLADVRPATLSGETQRILSHVPSKLDSEKEKSSKFSIRRVSPAIQTLPEKTDKVETFDAVGLSIKVRRPGLDANSELNRAYGALLAGESNQAIDIYKTILVSEPTNQEALFALAATCQRTGQHDMARSYYGKLLEINHTHRAGLNNFLALLGDESPEGALAELERLEQRNPSFAAIPAQEALVLKKLGYDDRAREKMIRAIELSPDNMTYKYNLAVLLDSSAHYPEAIALYRLLITASLQGKEIPESRDTLQKRLDFLVTNSVLSASAVN